ncbi:MAG: TolC family protein [Desulfarculaceae bacterium]|nr:TolC family protein [Desulfarculaceae bacterium]
MNTFLILTLAFWAALGCADMAVAAGAAPKENFQQIYLQARENDQNLLAEKAALMAIKMGKAQALARLLPKLNLEATGGLHSYDDKQSPPPDSGGTDNSDQHYDSKSYYLRLRQTLVDFSQWAQLFKERAVSRGSDYKLKGIEQNLILQMARLYFRVVETQVELELTQFEIGLLEQSLASATRSVELGLIPAVEQQKTKASLDLVNARAIATKNNLLNLLEDISVKTGRQHHRLAGLADLGPLLAPDPPDAQHWIWLSLKGNPDLAAKKEAVEAARMELNVQNSGHLPSLELAASHGYKDELGGTTPTENDSSYVMMLLKFPIFEGGMINAKAGEARYRLLEAQRRYKEYTRKVKKNTRASLTNIFSSVAMVRALNTAEHSNLVALQGSQRGFELGTVTTVDLLQSMAPWRRAQMELIRAKHQYILSWLRLYKTMGTLGEEHVTLVNKLLRPVN